jgi:hypothetical protein
VLEVLIWGVGVLAPDVCRIGVVCGGVALLLTGGCVVSHGYGAVALGNGHMAAMMCAGVGVRTAIGWMKVALCRTVV